MISLFFFLPCGFIKHLSGYLVAVVANLHAFLIILAVSQDIYWCLLHYRSHLNAFILHSELFIQSFIYWDKGHVIWKQFSEPPALITRQLALSAELRTSFLLIVNCCKTVSNNIKNLQGCIPLFICGLMAWCLALFLHSEKVLVRILALFFL